VFVGILTGAVVAFVLAQRGTHPERRADRWLVTPAFGLFAGWVTAAFFVGIVTVLVAAGVLSGGIGEALVGALTLIAGGAVACAVILAGGPPQGYLAYGGAVLWALAGIVVNQYQSSLLTTSVAAASALVVAAVLLFALRRRPGAAGDTGRPAKPRIA
jgi:hypothetical protein